VPIAPASPFEFATTRCVMPQRKWIILGLLVLVLTVGSEMTIGRMGAPRGCVQIVNQSDAPMEDLVASYGGTDVAVKRLGQGESINIWFTAGKRGVLSLDYQQKGNPLNGFKVPDFDPLQNRRDGFKLSLVVRNNLIERSVEDDETTTVLQTLGERIKRWVSSDGEPAP
jgi:hypothetical protein